MHSPSQPLELSPSKLKWFGGHEVNSSQTLGSLQAMHKPHSTRLNREGKGGGWWVTKMGDVGKPRLTNTFGCFGKARRQLQRTIYVPIQDGVCPSIMWSKHIGFPGLRRSINFQLFQSLVLRWQLPLEHLLSIVHTGPQASLLAATGIGRIQAWPTTKARHDDFMGTAGGYTVVMDKDMLHAGFLEGTSINIGNGWIKPVGAMVSHGAGCCQLLPARADKAAS